MRSFDDVRAKGKFYQAWGCPTNFSLSRVQIRQSATDSQTLFAGPNSAINLVGLDERLLPEPLDRSYDVSVCLLVMADDALASVAALDLIHDVLTRIRGSALAASMR